MWHISVLEMKAVLLALAAFLPQLSGRSVFLMSDNASVVTYPWHQGGTVSWDLCPVAANIILCSERHSVHLLVRCISGRKNILADQLSRPDQVLPMEFSLLLRVFKGVCSVVGHLHLDLFATQANIKLPLCILDAGPVCLEAGCVPAS